MLKKLLLICLCHVLSITIVLADPSVYGRDYTLRDGDSSSGPIWFLIVLVLVGTGAYNAFKKNEDDTNGKGCLASIIAVIIAFFIFAMIARALK